MKFKEIYNIAVPATKKNEEKFNIWVTIAVRPLSVIVTKPLTGTKVKPISVTALSLLMCIVGFLILAICRSMTMKLIGWLSFFAWAVLDGVDGNLARCTNQCSQLGDLWDTVSGYTAMVLIYFASGIIAFFDENMIEFCEPYYMLILGGATAVFSIFPRLVMHKKKSYGIESKAIKQLYDKNFFGLSQIVAMNFVSPSGFMQVIFLICILLHIMNFFVVFYTLVNLSIMSLSLYKLMRQ